MGTETNQLPLLLTLYCSTQSTTGNSGTNRIEPNGHNCRSGAPAHLADRHGRLWTSRKMGCPRPRPHDGNSTSRHGGISRHGSTPDGALGPSSVCRHHSRHQDTETNKKPLTTLTAVTTSPPLPRVGEPFVHEAYGRLLEDGRTADEDMSWGENLPDATSRLRCSRSTRSCIVEDSTPSTIVVHGINPLFPVNPTRPDHRNPNRIESTPASKGTGWNRPKVQTKLLLSKATQRTPPTARRTSSRPRPLTVMGQRQW